MNELCYMRGCYRPVAAYPIWQGSEVATCLKHHPYRRRLFVMRNLRRLARKLGVYA